MAENENENNFLDDIMSDPNVGPEDEMTLDEMIAEDDNIVALKTEMSQLKDGYMRALADVENSRKRADLSLIHL